MRMELRDLTPWLLGLVSLAFLMLYLPQVQGQEEDLYLDFFDSSVTYPIVDEQVTLNVTAFTDTNVSLNVTISVYDELEGEGIEQLIHNETLQYVDLEGIDMRFDQTWSPDQAGTHHLRFEIDPLDEHPEPNETNNNLSVDIIVSSDPTPELAFRKVDPMLTTPEIPLANESSQLIFSVLNEGHDQAGSFAIRFSERYEGGSYDQLEVRYYAELDQGSAIIDAFNWTPDRVGRYTLRLQLDVNDEVDEIVEDNNVHTLEVGVRAHLPELAWLEGVPITLASTDSWLDRPYVNHTLALTAYLENTDVEQDARGVEVEVWDTPAGHDQPRRLGRVALVQVLAQSSETVEPTPVTLNWQPVNGTDLAGEHLISMVIDPDSRLEEYDRSNNYLNTTVHILAARPDVLPLGIYVPNGTHDRPAEGIYTDVNISLANYGAQNVQDLRVDLLDNGEPIVSIRVALTQGTRENFTFSVFWRSNGWRNLNVTLDLGDEINELDEGNNHLETLVFVGLRHVDFALTYLDQPGEAFQAESYTAAVSLLNLASRVTQLEVQFYIDEVLLERRLINSLDNGQNRTLTFGWVVNQAIGVHNITVEARNENQSLLADEDLTNNLLQANFTVKPNLYQLYIYPFSFPERFVFNETVELTFTVVNLGEHAVEKVNVAIRIDENLYDIVEVGPVPSGGGQREFSVEWNPQVLGEHKITVIADYDDRVDEYNEQDNRASAVALVKQQSVEVIGSPTSQSVLDNPSLWLALLGLLTVVVLAALFSYRLRRQQDLLRPGPRAQVGPVLPGATVKVDQGSAICLECLRKVEAEAETIICACGKVYHPRCAGRANRCHSCGESLT